MSNFQLISRGFYGLLRKEFNRFLRIWPQTLLPPAITLILYFLIFGKVIGARVGLINGVSYMAFITPGLIMMPVIMNAYMNVVSSFFSAKFTRSIEELLVSPMPDWVIILGYCSGGVGRAMIIGFLGLILGMIFAGGQIIHPVLMFLVLTIASLMFSLGGFLNALFAKNFDDTTIVTTFILTPLIYLSGVFYSISQLPMFWQKVSLLNPLHYLVEIFRYSMLGFSSVNIKLSFLIIVLVTLGLLILNLVLMRRGSGLRG